MAKKREIVVIVRRMSKGMKKTVTPRLMSREEFFTKVLKSTDDSNV